MVTLAAVLRDEDELEAVLVDLGIAPGPVQRVGGSQAIVSSQTWYPPSAKLIRSFVVFESASTTMTVLADKRIVEGFGLDCGLAAARGTMV